MAVDICNFKWSNSTVDLFSALPPPTLPAVALPDPDESYFAPDYHRHDWYKATHVWTGETAERLVWRCKGCPELRGRA